MGKFFVFFIWIFFEEFVIHEMKHCCPEKNNDEIEEFREKFSRMFSDPTGSKWEK